MNKEFNLSEKIEELKKKFKKEKFSYHTPIEKERQFYINLQIIAIEEVEKDVKEFIKETLEDIEGGYEGEELLQRIRKRAGDELK